MKIAFAGLATAGLIAAGTFAPAHATTNSTQIAPAPIVVAAKKCKKGYWYDEATDKCYKKQSKGSH